MGARVHFDRLQNFELFEGLKYLCLRVWVPPFLFPSCICGEKMYCKQEPGSKIAILRPPRVYFFHVHVRVTVTYSVTHVFYIFSIPFVIFLLKFHI